mmetsp:Transcript_134214/g.189652  ORF Transcript_134214/g.189652 Transcript_134214/m.189652 type:complete len:113 (+) Transcript_134214:3-341(+)
MPLLAAVLLPGTSAFLPSCRRSVLWALPAALASQAAHAKLKPSDSDFSMSSLDKLEKLAGSSYNDPLACKKQSEGETRKDCLDREAWETECAKLKKQGKKCVPPPADLLSYR